MVDNQNDKMAKFEEMMSQALLVELLNEKKAEVFENVIFEGKRRYYIEDLSERDYSLENTTPYQLEIEGHALEAGAWTTMICLASTLLLTLHPEKKADIINFYCPWSKAKMFSNEERTNFKKVENDLYVNCNHTALHSCWFLQDLLDFFNIEKSSVSLLIHRPCSAEPKKVKDYIEKRFKSGFVKYIGIHFKKDSEYCNRVITVIERFINPILCSISRSYDNVFLFDNNVTMISYVSKICEKIDKIYYNDEKKKKVLNKYCSFLISYYKE